MKLFNSVLITLFFSGCGEKLNEVPEDRFLGTWQLQGRGMFEGIKVRIEKQNEKLVGRVVQLNENKFVKMFADSNEMWVSRIQRSSNFEFRLTERKIARDLFSLYGLPTSQEFRVQFIDENTMGLASDNSDPLQSPVIYKRIQ